MTIVLSCARGRLKASRRHSDPGHACLMLGFGFNSSCLSGSSSLSTLNAIKLGQRCCFLGAPIETKGSAIAKLCVRPTKQCKIALGSNFVELNIVFAFVFVLKDGPCPGRLPLHEAAWGHAPFAVAVLLGAAFPKAIQVCATHNPHVLSRM